MNAAATLSLVSVLAAVLVSLLSRRVALAPGSREQRWFAVVVGASAAYALFDLPTTVPGPPQLVYLAGGFAVAAVTVLTWAWIRFSQEFVGATPGRLERAVAAGMLAALPLIVIPGVLFSGEVIERPYPPLGALYRVAATTPIGDAAFAALLCVGTAVLVRFVRAWRRGVRHAGALSLAYATMLAFSLADALSVSLSLPMPFLLDWGWAAPVLAVGWMNTCRLVENARNLERLRADLVGEVEARTRALASTVESLHGAEKLAALGVFANGVAHEVNNPAAVVNATLDLLAGSEEVRLPPDEAEALADARLAMARITGLVRKLLDAAMVAVRRPEGALADVATAVEGVAARLHGAGASLALDLAAPDARVRLRPDALELVLETLVRNAADATAPGSSDPVVIGVERGDGRIRVIVSDRGLGMTPDVLRRAFDPFFTTKPQGHGTGLGLAVARGLVQAGGGTLALESAPGRGTRAIVELPEVLGADAAPGIPADAEGPSSPSAASTPATPGAGVTPDPRPDSREVPARSGARDPACPVHRPSLS